MKHRHSPQDSIDPADIGNAGRMVVPTTRYVKAPDGLNIAFQMVGDGPSDLVFISEWTTHVEAQWEYPPLARFLDGLAGFSRLILFDKRGVGLSDPLPMDAIPTLDRAVEDISVVMDAAGSPSAAIFATAGAGPMALVFAATHPDRIRALVLANTFARLAEARDYPCGVTAPEQAAYLRTVEADWGTGAEVEFFAPSRTQDAAFRAWLGRYRRLATSPGMGVRMQTRFYETDVRAILPIISAPTLVMHRGGDRFVPAAVGRYLADHIHGARYIELPGDDHLYYSGDSEQILQEAEEFLTGDRSARHTDRVLATVMFTDIVDSTGTASAVGDTRWHDLLDAHDAMVRRQLDRYRGREIKTTGDGFLATFDSPARAIHAAAAIREGAVALGINLRAGIHAGEIEQRQSDIGGIAVHVAQRILAGTAPNEIVVSSTVKDLV